jgi:uncharacterized protein YdhG (YjbR/CyaY superfamily)
MDALPTTAGPPATLPPIPTLTRRQERYARAMAEGCSYAEAFRKAGLVASTAGSQSSQIQDMNRNPAVRARIQELRAAASADTVDNLQERMAWLRLIVSADPNELLRTVVDPCVHCWPDAEIAKAYGAHFAPTPFHSERPALPNTVKPRGSCTHCAGVGVTRVTITPTDELSPAGRALFMRAEQTEKGAIKIFMQDQLAAADMLNKLVSAYVTRSMNLNANVAVPMARDVRPEDALKLFDAFAP